MKKFQICQVNNQYQTIKQPTELLYLRLQNYMVHLLAKELQ
jgi:hypothetical protein